MRQFVSNLQKLQKLINHGSCSYFVMFLFCGFSLLCGVAIEGSRSIPKSSGTAEQLGKAVVADRQGILMEYALSNPTMSEPERQSTLVEPVLGVLRNYSAQGYLVIDALKDESGAYFVSALPIQTKDITGELRNAVEQAIRDTSKNKSLN